MIETLCPWEYFYSFRTLANRETWVSGLFRRPTTNNLRIPESSQTLQGRVQPAAQFLRISCTYVSFISPTPESHRGVQRWLPRLACSVVTIGGTTAHPYAWNRLYIVEICAYIGSCTWYYHFTGYGPKTVRIWPTSPRSLARFLIRRKSPWVWISIAFSIRLSLESWSIANVGGTWILRLHQWRSTVSPKFGFIIYPVLSTSCITWPSGFPQYFSIPWFLVVLARRKKTLPAFHVVHVVSLFTTELGLQGHCQISRDYEQGVMQEVCITPLTWESIVVLFFAFSHSHSTAIPVWWKMNRNTGTPTIAENWVQPTNTMMMMVG